MKVTSPTVLRFLPESTSPIRITTWLDTASSRSQVCGLLWSDVVRSEVLFGSFWFWPSDGGLTENCSVPGDDNYGRKLIVFSSCCLPPSHQLNHRRLLEYVLWEPGQNPESRNSNVLLLQVPEVHPGPVRGDGLHPGLLPPRSEEQQQAVSEMVTRGVRRVRQEVRQLFTDTGASWELKIRSVTNLHQKGSAS